MAILTFAAPVSGLRGKVGGNVFSANKSGPYLKAWGRGANPRTLIQSEHRADLTFYAQKWATLSASEQAGWDTYAALAAQDKTNSLGETYSASGFNWYIEINLNLRAAGESDRDAAPTSGTPGTPILDIMELFKTSGSDNSDILLDASSPEDTENHVVKMRLFNSVGRQVASEIRLLLRIIAPSGTPKRIAFQAQLNERFGTVQENQIGFASVAIQSDQGRRGAVATISAIVQA